MAEIMILGDLHGNTLVACMAVQQAAALGVETIIQVGDFGMWDHFKDGIVFLDELNRELLDNEVILVWLDGNHECFDRLEWYCANNPKNQWGQVFIRSNILYSPRGCKFKLEGKHFMTVGGAVSVDKDWRQKQQGKRHTHWWPQEQLTDNDLDVIIKRYEASPGYIDYLFTHDCPTNAPFKGRMKNDMDSQIHRQRMDRLGEAVKPGLWFHGHMHTKYNGYDFPTYNSTTTVYGLECDGMRWNWGILDTDTDTFVWGEKLTSFLDTEDSWTKRDDGMWIQWDDPSWLSGHDANDEGYDLILPD